MLSTKPIKWICTSILYVANETNGRDYLNEESHYIVFFIRSYVYCVKHCSHIYMATLRTRPRQKQPQYGKHVIIKWQAKSFWVAAKEYILSQKFL